jgi:hypothetical protein
MGISFPKTIFLGQHLGDHHLSKGSHNTFPLCKGGLTAKEMKTRPTFWFLGTG